MNIKLKCQLPWLTNSLLSGMVDVLYAFPQVKKRNLEREVWPKLKDHLVQFGYELNPPDGAEINESTKKTLDLIRKNFLRVMERTFI